MSKIAVLTDSNSGITPKEAKELGLYVIPMPFYIEDQEFFEEVNMTQEEFYERIDEKTAISTSQPSLEYVGKKWDELLKEYDQIVYIPMSSGLSGSCSSARALSLDYDGKVEVVDNQRISVTLRRSCLDALRLAGEGKNAAEIREILERTGLDASIYITLDTLTYLKRGGRITPAAAAIGTLLKIKPVLQIQGEKLDAFATVRTIAQARKIMIKSAIKDIENRFGGMEAHEVDIDLAYTGSEDAIAGFEEEVKEAFPWIDKVYAAPLSLSVGCHIGPGAFAIALSHKLHIS